MSGNRICTFALVLAACSAPQDSDRPRTVTILSDRDADLYALMGDRRVALHSRVAAGVPARIVVELTGSPLAGWPMFLRTVDGDAIAVLDPQEPRGVIRDADWMPQDAAARAAFDTAIAGRIEIGMPKDLLILAWGLPVAVPSSARTTLGSQEIWQYRRGSGDVLVYLAVGRVDRVREF